MNTTRFFALWVRTFFDRIGKVVAYIAGTLGLMLGISLVGMAPLWIGGVLIELSYLTEGIRVAGAIGAIEVVWFVFLITGLDVYSDLNQGDSDD